MTTLPRRLVWASLLVASCSLPAWAQNTAPAAPAAAQASAAPGQRAQAMQERMQKRHAERLERLKKELAITPAQEAAWSSFTQAMQPPAWGPQAARENWAAMTTPERIDRMRSLRAERQAQMDRRGDAIKTFYAALDAEQQKRFDAQALHGQKGRKGGWGEGRMGHHHGHAGQHRGGMMGW